MNINNFVIKIEEFLCSDSTGCLELVYWNCNIKVYGTKSESIYAGEVHFSNNNAEYDWWSNNSVIVIRDFSNTHAMKRYQICKALIELYQ